MIKRSELPYLVLISDDGIAYSGSINPLFYKDELIKIRNACNQALKTYDLYNVDDDSVHEENQKSIKKEFENKNVSKRKTNDTPTYIYIMIDHNTGYYKIGHSKNVLRRESTLQSEKPTIELLYSFEGIVRDERELHDNFKELRVRGEWFALEKYMVDNIITQFECKRIQKERRKEREGLL